MLRLLLVPLTGECTACECELYMTDTVIQSGTKANDSYHVGGELCKPKIKLSMPTNTALVGRC